MTSSSVAFCENKNASHGDAKAQRFLKIEPNFFKKKINPFSVAT